MTQLELTALRNLHIKGVFGMPFGTLPLKDRRKYIKKWINAGYLTQAGNITAKGIDASLPSVQPIN